MLLNEDIYEDTSAWEFFEGETEDTEIAVYRRCPHCGRYTTIGDVYLSTTGSVSLKNWRCKKHGEVKPYYEMD